MAEFYEKVFTEVVRNDGHGRVHTYGLGPSPTDVFPKVTKEYDALKRSQEEQTTLIEMMQEEILILGKKIQLMEDQGNIENPPLDASSTPLNAEQVSHTYLNLIR